MEDYDILMFCEVVMSEFYNFKLKSSERGKVWESIVIYLNFFKMLEFRVIVRVVRDWYVFLIFWYKLKKREEEKVFGIDVLEFIEFDVLLEEIWEWE